MFEKIQGFCRQHNLLVLLGNEANKNLLETRLGSLEYAKHCIQYISIRHMINCFTKLLEWIGVSSQGSFHDSRSRLCQDNRSQDTLLIAVIKLYVRQFAKWKKSNLPNISPLRAHYRLKLQPCHVVTNCLKTTLSFFCLLLALLFFLFTSVLLYRFFPSRCYRPVKLILFLL